MGSVLAGWILLRPKAVVAAKDDAAGLEMMSGLGDMEACLAVDKPPAPVS